MDLWKLIAEKNGRRLSTMVVEGANHGIDNSDLHEGFVRGVIEWLKENIEG